MKNDFAVGIAALLLSVSATAGDYIGIQVGQSFGHRETLPMVMQSYTLDERSEVGRISVGHDAGWWGIEAGYTPRLSQRDTHAVGTRPEGDFDIKQRITTTALDLRGRIGLQLSPRLSADLFAGIAFVEAENHEVGFNTSDHTPTEFRNTMTQFAPEFGIGLRYRINDRFSLTAEVDQVRHVAESRWTVYSDITTAMLGARIGF